MVERRWSGLRNPRALRHEISAESLGSKPLIQKGSAGALPSHGVGSGNAFLSYRGTGARQLHAQCGEKDHRGNVVGISLKRGF